MGEREKTKVVKLSAKRLELMFSTLTPEQKFKWLILHKLIGEKNLMKALSRGISIDMLFSNIADEVISRRIPFFNIN